MKQEDLYTLLVNLNGAPSSAGTSSAPSPSSSEPFLLMDSSVTPLPRFPELSLVQTTDFFYPNIDSPYWQGMVACANVLSDLYAMGVTECDNMLMILGVCRDKAMLDSDRWRTTELMMKGFGEQARRAGSRVTGGQSVMSPWFIIGGVASSVARDKDIIKYVFTAK